MSSNTHNLSWKTEANGDQSLYRGKIKIGSIQKVKGGWVVVLPGINPVAQVIYTKDVYARLVLLKRLKERKIG